MRSLIVLCCLAAFCVLQNIPVSSAYKEAVQAKVHVDSLYKILNSKLLTLKMKINQIKKKIYKTNYDLIILRKLKHLLLKLIMNKHNSCEHEYVLLDFLYKQSIKIEAKADLPAHYTITLKVDNKSLVNQSRVEKKKKGQDLHVFYLPRDGATPIEIDRLVHNLNTNNTTVQFRIQRAISSGTVDMKSYSLVFGGKYNQQAKADPKRVYAFYDNFEASSLQGWSQVWGEWTIKKGRLFGKTGKSSHGSGEVGLYLKQGQNWGDIEIELDLMETGGHVVFPGPFFRVKDHRLQHTTAWWFEYYTDHKECTMRPNQNNKDGGWKYKCSLPKTLSKNKWFHFKYLLQGSNIKQWANGKLIQDVNVDKKWMISKGTIALGCHSTYSGSKVGCRTYYDNIKVRLLTQNKPTVSLGQVCNIAHHGKSKLGTKEQPANSCKEIHDTVLTYAGKPHQNGVYWIKTDAVGKRAFQTFCDLRQGGWTLVGKIIGQAGNIYNTWLVRNVNVELLKSPNITSGNIKYGCLDARRIAVKHSSEIMFSSGDNSLGVGVKWIRWQLPAQREVKSWWNHGVGYSKVKAAATSTVTVKAWNGKTKVCYQNKYGVMPYPYHGGSYPYTSYDQQGNTRPNDYCMAVGVLLKGSSADGWSQNANGYDSPQSDSDWPNKAISHQKPYLLVWLK